MCKCTCKECVFRKTNEEGKTLATKEGLLICNLGVKDKVKATDSCIFSRSSSDPELTPQEMMKTIKNNLIEFTEDAFLGRRLSIVEKPLVKKYVKKYYPDFTQ